MVKNKSEILITVLTTSSVSNRTPNLPSVFIDGFDLKKKLCYKPHLNFRVQRAGVIRPGNSGISYYRFVFLANTWQ